LSVCLFVCCLFFRSFSAVNCVVRSFVCVVCLSYSWLLVVLFLVVVVVCWLFLVVFLVVVLAVLLLIVHFVSFHLFICFILVMGSGKDIKAKSTSFCYNNHNTNLTTSFASPYGDFGCLGGSSNSLQVLSLPSQSGLNCGGIPPCSMLVETTPNSCSVVPLGFTQQSCTSNINAATPADLIVVGRAALIPITTPPSTPTSNINGVYVVNGPTTIVGNLNVGPGSSIVLSPGASLTIQGMLTLASNSSLVVQLGDSVAVGPNTISVFAVSGGISGTFGNVSAAFRNATCLQATNPSPSYTPTAISVTVNVNNDGCGLGGGKNEDDFGGCCFKFSNAGAIAGIVIACIIVGILVGILVVWLTMRQKHKRIAEFKEE
jgi:hypothetical protein